MKNNNVSFVQMADPQFGMYSSISKLSDADTVSYTHLPLQPSDLV